MSSRAALLLGAGIVLFSGIAAWLGAQAGLGVAPPSAPEPLPGRSEITDLRSQVEELSRQIRYLADRVDRLERSRDVDPSAGAREEVEGDAGAPGPGRAAVRPAVEAASAAPDEGPQLTEEELLEQRKEKLREFGREAARRYVPLQLTELANDTPEAVESRRREAILQARQVAHAAGLSDDAAIDRLQEAYVEHVTGLARDVGPLVKDGLDTADLAGVRTKLDENWSALDARVKSIVGEQRFATYEEIAAARRTEIREVLAERLEQRR